MTRERLQHASAAVASLAMAIAVTGCGARTSLGFGNSAGSSCNGLAPTCVAPAGDPCGAQRAVAAACDDASHEWSCPTGSQVYARAAEQPATCLPFRQQAGIASIAGSLVRVPTDDGRCLWIAEDVSFTDASPARNVAFEVDPSAPFASCPKASAAPPTPVVTIVGGDDPSLLVQVDGGYVLGGRTHVIYRLFRLDSSSPFGVTEIGGGVAAWDASLKRIVVPAPGSFPWGLDLDLGDAMLVRGNDAFVWGCPQPPSFLTENCFVARLDASDAVQLLSKGGQWIASTSGADGKPVFDSGPWISSVVPTQAGGLLHVYAVGFGTNLHTHVATDPTGPWSPGADLARCDLPGADSKAFCAGPVVHEEIGDPTRPGEYAVTYGVGSTGTRTSNADDYWTRLVWVK